MRILVDEDLASRELLRRLEAILPGNVMQAPPGSSDAEVWRQAQAQGALVLTGNVTDSVRLAAGTPGHHGVLLVYRQNDATRDLRAVDVVEAVRAIEATYPEGLDDTTLAVNGFVRR